MAESNFDKNFNTHKTSFKQKFGIEWNANPELYVQYLQTLYLSTLTELVNTGLSQILSRQEDTNRSVQGLSQKIK